MTNYLIVNGLCPSVIDDSHSIPSYEVWFVEKLPKLYNHETNSGQDELTLLWMLSLLDVDGQIPELLVKHCEMPRVETTSVLTKLASLAHVRTQGNKLLLTTMLSLPLASKLIEFFFESVICITFCAYA